VGARRRLDAELVRRGLAASRLDATTAIDDRRVLVNGAVAEKAARLVAPADAVTVLGPPARFVGRGGEKLDAALASFGVEVAGRRWLDVGASTGGFTDCLLAHGAAHVVALDVGHGQLHPKLRDDDRVTVLERTNVRDAEPDTLGGLVEGIVVDVSFISLRVIIPVLVALCQPGSPMVMLVKPQFEAGREEASRGRGVITDPQIHERVRLEIHQTLVEAGCDVRGWIDSPILGGHGNRELLVHAVREST
jgi:23S rRNA (cytidine1920-2'-O)/16S rRNA (cytidine1409-2'-O)-methyltransferase